MDKFDAQAYSFMVLLLTFKVWLKQVGFQLGYWLINEADEQAQLTCQMNSVNAQTFSLGLNELKFQFWLNSVMFQQSYSPFSFATDE